MSLSEQLHDHLMNTIYINIIKTHTFELSSNTYFLSKKIFVKLQIMYLLNIQNILKTKQNLEPYNIDIQYVT